MLRFLWSVGITGAAALAVSVGVLRASAQTVSDYDSTCYLRIEGRSTQDLARLCGKKKQPADLTKTTSVPGRPLIRSMPSPASRDPDDDSTDGDEPTPVRSPVPLRSPIATPSLPPAIRLPPTVPPPVLQLPVPPRTSTLPPTPTPTVRLLPAPQPPATLQPQATQPQAAAPDDSAIATPRSLTQRTRTQAQSRPALKPQRTFQPRSSDPIAQTSPPVVDSRAQAPTSKPPAAALDVLFQQLMQQKHLYLFWVLFLQVPLLKVAIDRRSQTRRTVPPLAAGQKRQRAAATVVVDRVPPPDGSSVVDPLTDEAIAASIAPSEPEDITRAAEYHLSQADNQIAQIKVLLASAVRNRVSDIHLEPAIEGLRVRYRIDGILRDVTMLPLEVSRRTIVALKVMADMDIAESRRPQDARISEQYTSETTANLDLDLRVSTLPCVGGEKAVIRLLPRQNPFSQMEDLGFTEKALALYQGWLQQPQGMIIFTGPTGSGKTSTLYTSLQAIATETVNVVTVEDPVEYILPSITQTQVNETAGMTFPAGLRAILRQDPDIIMVGEIRDGETAETAVRAALTGHLVLTTLHTNDAIGAIPRLKDIGPDPGLISDALLGVVAQRLVRRVCPHCAAPYTPTDADLTTLHLSRIEANSQAWRLGKGCNQCFHSGYLGREAMIELVNVDDTIRQIIYDGSLTELTHYLNAINFDSFRKAAIAKVTTGITTIAEIRRVLPASKLAIDS